MTLEERIRELIGNGGPQLTTEEYEQRIDNKLDYMSVRELLYYLSLAWENET